MEPPGVDEKKAKRSLLSDASTSIRSGIDRKLHRLAGPVHSGVSAPAERPRDIEVEAGGQRPADAEAGGQKLADAGSQRSEGQRGSESKSRGPGPARSGTKLEDKYIKKSHSIFDSF